MAKTKAEANKRMRALLQDALSQPLPNMTADEFEKNFGNTIQFAPGLTYEEILVAKLVAKACTGDNKSIQEIFDRLLGKPTQTNENVNHNMSYIDYLDKFAKEDADIQTLDSEPDTPLLPEDLRGD